MTTAKTIEQQILWSINKFEYMSWGISKKAAIEYEGMATLALRVSGAVHKGWVFISLNEGMDCYEVRLLNVARTKVKRTLEEVYCDNLGQVLDGLIERKAEWTDEQYKNKAARDSARKLGVDVIGVSKHKTEETMTKNEVKFRPATMAEIEGRDTDLYMDGEQVWVMMIHHSETIGEGEPKLDYIMLTNMKKVQVEDLQVIDNNNNEPEDKTMATKKNNNESKNVQNAQVNNNAAVEDVNVGEVTVDSIMPVMQPVEGSEYSVQSDGKTATFESVAPNIEPEKPAVTPQTSSMNPEPSSLPMVHLVVYTTKRGEQAPRIEGFGGENDPRWKRHYDEKVRLAKEKKEADAFNEKLKAQMKGKTKDEREKLRKQWKSVGSDPFGASYFTDRTTGDKYYQMTMGAKYLDVARELVDAYNSGDEKAIAAAEQAVIDCKKGIVANIEAENAARDAEREAKKKNLTPDPSPNGDGSMSGEEQAMFDLFKKFMAGDKDAMAKVNAVLNKAA